MTKSKRDTAIETQNDTNKESRKHHDVPKYSVLTRPLLPPRTLSPRTSPALPPPALALSFPEAFAALLVVLGFVGFVGDAPASLPLSSPLTLNLVLLLGGFIVPPTSSSASSFLELRVREVRVGSFFVATGIVLALLEDLYFLSGGGAGKGATSSSCSDSSSAEPMKKPPGIFSLPPRARVVGTVVAVAVAVVAGQTEGVGSSKIVGGAGGKTGEIGL